MEENTNFNSISFDLSKYNTYTKQTLNEFYFSSLVNLISTPKGSHPYDPDYGTLIRTFILQPATNETRLRMETDVRQAIQTYLPDLFSQIHVAVTIDDNNGKPWKRYKLHIIINDVIVDFDISKTGNVSLSDINY